MKLTIFKVMAQCENTDLGAVLLRDKEWCQPAVVCIIPHTIISFRCTENDEVILYFIKGPRYKIAKADFDKMAEIIDLTESTT